MDDNAWLILFLLLLAYGEKTTSDISTPEIKLDDTNQDLTAGILQSIHNFNAEQFEDDQRYISNCPHVEWEQDMGAHIPFCGLDGQMCNLQCKKSHNFHPL